MKLKAIICLFLISLLSCFILGSCDKNHDEDKEVFSLEEWKSYYGLLNQKKSLTFDNFEHLQKSFQKTPQEDATYYYVINTEVYSNNNLRGSYEYSYDLKEFTTVDNEEIFVISVSDINISSAGMPKKVDCGPIKIGGGPRTIYYYTAYPTNNTQTPITIKHSLLADSPTRLMLFYQNDKLIGKMQYLPALADDEYYEEFFKNCLCVISGSPSLVKNKDTIDYQEEIKEFSAADTLILISDFNEFFGGLFKIDEILKDKNYLTLRGVSSTDKGISFEDTQYEYLYNQTEDIEYLSASGRFYDLDLNTQNTVDYIFYSYGSDFTKKQFTYKHFLTTNQNFPFATFIYYQDTLIAKFFYDSNKETVTDDYIENFLNNFTQMYWYKYKH